MLEGVPHFGSVADFCRITGFSRSFALDLKAGGLLVLLTIENRDWIDIPATLKRLHEAAANGQPLTIPGETRAADLARKTRLREERRARARTLARQTRRKRRQPSEDVTEPSPV